MHIYAKQCEILQKKLMKNLKRTNSLFLQGEASSAVLKTWLWFQIFVATSYLTQIDTKQKDLQLSDT